MVPFTVPPVPPGGQQFFWEVSGIYLSSSLKKYHQKHQECRFSENCPPCWSRLLSPLSPLGDKKFLGGFWHLSQLKFEEISPKIPRTQILRKLAPLLPPVYLPPSWPPWGSKKFLGGFWHLFMSNPSHLAQKVRQNHQFWSNRCMTPSVAALCNGITFEWSAVL